MKEIVKNIADNLSEYEKNHKIVDENFIRNVVEIYTKYYNLKDFVRDFKFGYNVNLGNKPSYNIENKAIYFPYEEEIDKCNMIIDHEFNNNHIKLNKDSLIQYINFHLIGAIIHELTHARQYFKCLNNDSDFETFLLNYGLEKNLILLKNNKIIADENLKKYIYHIDFLESNNYDYLLSVPHERMAYITENIYKVELSKYFDNEKYTRLNNILKLKDISNKIISYENFIPSIFIVDAIENVRRLYGLSTNFNNLNEIIRFMYIKSSNDEYSLDDKLYYGLICQDDEIEQLKDEETNLQRKIKKY